MNAIEKELINKLAAGKLSRDAFLNQYPVNLKKDEGYIINGLKTAYGSQNSEDVEYFLSLVSFHNGWNTDSEYAFIFSKLLTEEWHFSHENIASLLQGSKNPATVDCLYNACFLQLDYMDYDDTYSLARKCIHALGDINTEHSIEKLKLLATSDIPIIKEKAEKQLYYHKR